MISSNLKEIMEKKGVTLKRMAWETGLAEMTLIRARGRLISQCRLSTLEIMAAYLGCATKDLYEESRPREEEEPRPDRKN